jgi:lipoyl(octanoyl) transferase
VHHVARRPHYSALTSEKICRLLRLEGLTDYAAALDLQRRLAAARANREITDDILLLLEHPRVITLGRRARKSNVVATADALAGRGVELHEVERGGDVTYHGPGQLIGYPILDLTRHRRDVHWYLRQLEEVLLRTLSHCGVSGVRVPGYTGVWVEDRKIASIGVHVTRWVTFHGFALNVCTDLADFDLIVPCGIDAVQMTSVEREAGRPYSVEDVVPRVARAFGEIFGCTMQPVALQELA